MQQNDSINPIGKQIKIPYIALLSALVIIMVFTYLWRPLNPNRAIYIPLTQEVQTTVVENRDISTIVGKATLEIVDDNAVDEPNIIESSDQPIPEDEIVSDEIDEVIGDKNDNVQYIVSKGDTLYGILMQYGVNRSDIYALTKQYKQLANLRIGQQINWTVDDKHNLIKFIWIISNSNVKIYEKTETGFTEKVESREGIWQPLNIQGKIESSFVVDAKKSGLKSNEIAIITKALQWQLDFRKLRKDDEFSVIISREMFGDEYSSSRLLAVRIRNNSKDYYAILAEDGYYYNINGEGLSQSFLRYPLLKQARISSGFNPRRLHPVTKKIMPHNGVDFAVSKGTPVLSVGDGEVVVAKYSGSAGNYIAIRHGRQYTTRYMHLDKILVKLGQKVKKGDRIGLSGNTGRSTGPHLHYELHIDGKPVNPLTATLPVSGGLTGKSKTAFLEQVKEIKEKLKVKS